MATYVNDLRLKEIATGDEDGIWGVSTNTNLSLIADAFSYGTEQLAANADETFTMADGTADGVRSIYLKFTSAVSLTATRTVTLGPNTISKLWIIENATTGSQSIIIAQGSGATITIATGTKAMLYTDGAGAGAAVALAGPTISTLTGTLPVANGGTGQSSNFTQYGVVYAPTTTTLGNTGAGTTTTVLHGNAGGAPTYAAVALAADVSGTLPVANGGTSLTTLTANNVILGNGASAPTFVAPSTSGNVLTSNGTTWASTTPAFSGTVTSVAATVPTFLSVAGSPITSSGTLAVTLSGTALPVTSGGIGATTLTANYALLGNGASAPQMIAPGAIGNVLTSDGTTWASSASLAGGTVTSVAATVPAFLSVAGSPITAAGTLAITLSGTALPAVNGGTGITSTGSSGNILTSNGTTWTSSAPATSGTVTSVAATVPSIFSISGSPITSSGTLAMTYSGTALPVANGGTSLTTLTANNVILGNGASAPTFVAPSSSGNVLTSNGTTWASTAPAASGISAGLSIALAMVMGF